MSEQVKEGKIDEAVKEILSSEDVVNALADDKQLKRFILNAFCEMLSEIKNLHGDLEQLNSTVAMLGQDKIKAYFKALEKNVKTEESVQDTLKRVRKSHQKAKKN